MTALTAIAPCGSPAHMRLFRLIRDGVVQAEMVKPDAGGRVYNLADVEVLVALTVLALRDLPDVPLAVARCIRQRPVAPAGEWLVVAADGTVRRHEHLCLDDLTPFDAAHVVRLTPAVSDAEGVGVLPVDSPPVAPDSGAVGSALSRPAATGGSTFP